ncbi:MAG TPA: dUTP diphosphatase [Bacilli bacterium]|nr:dUTP diphosphatase [Bacilli bacterium]
MSEVFALNLLFSKQSELDRRIHADKNVDYASTLVKRKLALLVELGEFANATRTFKFWSTKTGESKERLLDEYADVLHFLLSLGLAKNLKVEQIEFLEPRTNVLSTLILDVYQKFETFFIKESLAEYKAAFASFLTISKAINFSESDIIDAYLKKNAENFKRQDNNY